jgi:iron complex transport system substrate-binding protein
MTLRTLLACIGLWLALLTPAHAAADSYVDGTKTSLPYGLDAKRIVSLAPNVTEMLFFLGLGDRVVGRSDYCNYPPQVLKLPSVGGFTDTSLEEVIRLKPDLVVAYQGNSLRLIEQLRKSKVEVVAFEEASTLDAIGKEMRALWRIASANNAPEPKALVGWRARLDKSTKGGYPESAAAGPSMFFGYPDEVAYTAGPGSFVDDLMLRVGCRNAAASTKDHWPQVSAEFVLAAQPQWLLTATNCTEAEDAAQRKKELLAELKADPVWKKLPAVAKGQVIVIDADVLLRPGPRILDALAAVRQALGSGAAQASAGGGG